MAENERQQLLNMLLPVLIPLDPKASHREKERVELMRSLHAKACGWMDCPIEKLRWEVYGNAAA